MTNQLLKGVGGWLLVLCIILTFITPAMMLINLGSTNEVIDALGTQFPIYRRMLFGMQFVYFGLICYCLYSGVSLWRSGNGAVAKVQRFLIAYAIFALCRAITPYLGDLSVDLRTELVEIYVPSFLKAIFFSAFWHQYLARSVRVKNTYAS